MPILIKKREHALIDWSASVISENVSDIQQMSNIENENRNYLIAYQRSFQASAMITFGFISQHISSFIYTALGNDFVQYAAKHQSLFF